MIRFPFCPFTPFAANRPARVPGRHARPGMLVAACAVALFACEAPVQEFRVVGQVDIDGKLDPVGKPRMPETAIAGVPFDISFLTHGDACYRAGDTEVVAGDGRSVTVTPYDFLMATSCFSVGEFFEHGATLVFDDPGTAEIVLRYSIFGGAVESHRADGQRTFTVQVLPAG